MKYLIVGNGVAGITAAKILREKSAAADIALITDEKYHYYNRPSLIDFISGRKKEDELYFYTESWYASNKIKVLLDKTAEKIDFSQKKLYLDDGVYIDYDKMIIASGARSNLPPIPGVETNPDVLTLRCLDDAKNLIKRSSNVSKIAVIGGGVLGLEAACAIKNRFPAIEITILEMSPWLLPRQLDKMGAEVLEAQLKKLDIQKILTNIKIISVEKLASGVKLNIESSGQKKELIADIVLVSAGVKPNVELALNSGISVGKGIIVNEYLETSAPDIYAAGDVVEFNKTVWGIIPAAIEQSRVAASNVLTPKSASYKGTIIANTLKVAGLDLTTEGSIISGEDIMELTNSDDKNGIYKKIFIKKENGMVMGFICLGDKAAAKKFSQILKAAKHISEQEATILIS